MEDKLAALEQVSEMICHAGQLLSVSLFLAVIFSCLWL